MYLTKDEAAFLAKLDDYLTKGNVHYMPVEGRAVALAYSLHERKLASYLRGNVWITYEGRKYLSKLAA